MKVLRATLSLFDNPELSGNYTQLLQHLTMINQIQNINIRQRKTELSRIKDLQEHGAATGKDLCSNRRPHCRWKKPT
jgi:cobalt-zinc-cadmium efflux system membrane fusion protein